MAEFASKFTLSSNLLGFVVFSVHCFVACIPHSKIFCPDGSNDGCHPKEARGAVTLCLLFDQVLVL